MVRIVAGRSEIDFAKTTIKPRFYRYFSKSAEASIRVRAPPLPPLFLHIFRCAFLLRRFGIPDLDIVEEAILAGDAELDLGFGGVADAGGLEEADGLAVDGDAHGVAAGLDGEGVPFMWLELDRETGRVDVGGFPRGLKDEKNIDFFVTKPYCRASIRRR